MLDNQRDKDDRLRLLDMANAFRKSRILLTAFDLGIFDALSCGKETSPEIAAECGTDIRATDRLLNALCVLELVNKKAGSFSNSPLASRYLITDSPDAMMNLHHISNLFGSWATMTDAVRLGHAASDREARFQGDDWLRSFIAAMHWRGVAQANVLADSLDLSGIRRLLDIGGGSGAFAMAMVNKSKEMTATVFDLPDVVPLTEGYIEQAGLSSRIGTHAGDYLVDELPAGYDLALLSAVIHSNSYEQNRTLIEKVFQSLLPGGQIVILDFIMDEERLHPEVGALFALNMLVATEGGDSFTEQEIAGMLEGAGFVDIKQKEAASLPGMMSARRP